MNIEKKSKSADIWLTCFKYAPGNWQHMKSFAERANENGFVVRYVMSKYFSWMVEESSGKVTYFTQSKGTLSIIVDVILFFVYRWINIYRLLRADKPQAIILVMWHPLNAVICIMAKLMVGAKTIVWLHEPYKDDKRVYGKKAIVFHMVEWIQSSVMPWLDDIVVHSKIALRSFRKRYPKAKQAIHLIPLLFQDQAPAEKQGPRQLVSFLGKAAKAKGVDVFFEFIEEAALMDPELRFGIATCDDISMFSEKLSPEVYKRLEVVSDPNLSDAAIREMASRSLAIFCLYSSTMQSGVIPVAFMCGTPVIATDIEGLKEVVETGKTGYVVPLGANTRQIYEAVASIKENFPTFSRNCRNNFLTTNDDSNWCAHYDWLIKSLRRKNGQSESR